MDKKSVVLIGVGVIGLGLAAHLLTKGETVKTTTEKQPYKSLGLRNKNPMNIVYNVRNNWKGQTGHNGRFCTFESQDYGLRAGAILLRNYMVKYHLNSVRGIINRFAPTNENATAKYSEFVARKVGVNEFDNKLTPTNIPALIMAIVQFENGINPFSEEHVKGVVANAIN